MLSLCKKEIQFQNLLKKIVNSEHKIYLLIQIVKFSNSDKKVKWPQAATAASNVYGSLDLLFNIPSLVKPLIRFMRPSPNWSLSSFFLETFHSHSILLYLCYLSCPEFTFISNQNIHPNIVWYVLWKEGFLVLDFSERIVRFWGHKKQDEFCINRLTLNFWCFFNFFCFFAALWLISELHGFILHILNSNFWQYFICLLGKLLWGFDDNSVCKHMRVNSMLHSTTNPIYNTLSMVCFKIIPFNVDWMIKFWEHEEGKLTTELWSTAIRPKFDSFNVIISLHRRQNKVA